MSKIDETQSYVEQLNGFYLFDKNTSLDLKPQPQPRIDAKLIWEKYCSYRHRVDSIVNNLKMN